MSRIAQRRFLGQCSLGIIKRDPPVKETPLRCMRAISTTSRRRADGDPTLGSFNFPPLDPKSPPRTTNQSQSPESSSSPSTTKSAASSMSGLSALLQANQQGRASRYNSRLNSMGSEGNLLPTAEDVAVMQGAHHFYVYALKHNCHITVTSPEQKPLIVVACGNLGFRKSARKHYDSAFQLASYVMNRMQESGLNSKIERLEVTLRGFGAGREAVTKALLGSEGRFLRGKITKVTDSTKLKFGGTRSKKPRRLG